MFKTVEFKVAIYKQMRMNSDTELCKAVIRKVASEVEVEVNLCVALAKSARQMSDFCLLLLHDKAWQHYYIFPDINMSAIGTHNVSSI